MGMKARLYALAELGTDRDVLQVGIGARQPPGGGRDLLVIRVHAPVLWVHQWGEGVDVSVLELRQLPVLEQLRNEGVLIHQRLQRPDVGRQARLGTASRLQPQLLVEQGAQLSRRAQVDPLAGELVALVLELFDALRRALAPWPRDSRGRSAPLTCSMAARTSIRGCSMSR